MEEGMVTHSSILAWRIPRDRGAWWATVHGIAESDMTEQLSTEEHITLCNYDNLRIHQCRILAISLEKKSGEISVTSDMQMTPPLW